MTSNPDHDMTSTTKSKVDIDEVFRGVRPIASVDELAASDIFESDEELDEFLTAVRADRDADLA